jgi:glycosyltransferase involved in cell wall biosynthesis
MAGYYIPSVKAGGPVQSIKNLVDNFSEKIEFYIVAADRDMGDNKPFDNITTDTWVDVGNAKVYYTDKSRLTWRKIRNLLNGIEYDVLYLVSFFSYRDGIVPIVLNKLKKIPRKKIVMAPSGQFSSGALGLKSAKKKLYILTAKVFNLYDEIVWHATTNFDKIDIQKVFGNKAAVYTASELTPNYKQTNYHKKISKKPGELKLVYLSRIHPMKNLLQILEILLRFNDHIEFSIYGPLEDNDYWNVCKKLISRMQDNVKVQYYGLISNHLVNDIYQRNHVFILLTLGENFGHAISEALWGGCPVIISDRTPWRNLETLNAGWDLPLGATDLIEEKIRYALDMDNDEYMQMSKNAFLFGKNNSNNEVDLHSYDEMLNP